MVGVGKSNVGMLRPRNEDSILVSNEAIGVLPNVFVVADGMGGHKAGNVASASAIEGFIEFVKKPENESEEVLDVMISAVSYANGLVHKLSQEHEEYSNMGSTFIACCIDNNSAYIAHVGDSRLYLYRDGELNQITNDHSLVAEMVRSGRMTEEEAEARTVQMLNMYADFCEQYLAIPVVKGQKTEKEKFAGAHSTYTIEALMHDGKALQSGTSHNFGDGFAKAFDIQYTDKDNKLQYVHQTSWGMSTRIIGAIIMVHGDDSGLVLPPRIAPVQTMIVPIMQKKEGVLDKAEEIRKRLASSYKVKVDDSDKSPGWKFSEQEVRGIPTRIEIGPKDIEKNQAVIVRRDTREKIIVSLDEIETKLGEVLEQMQNDMLERAKKHLEEHTVEARNWDEFKAHIEKQDGFVKAMWCGETECEEAIKDETTATTRCMPFEQEHLSDVCVHCGKPAKKMVYFGKAY